MKPLDSPQDRAITIKTFINARLNKNAKVTNYEPLVNYLNGNHLEVLYKNLPRSGPSRDEIKMLLTNNKLEKISAIYNETDAKMYLNWLISVVQGFSLESSNEELVNKAFDQLSTCILILTDVTEWKDGAMLAKPYDWVDRLINYQEATTDSIDSRMKDLKEMLDRWNDDVNHYGKKVDALCDSVTEQTDNFSKTSQKQTSDLTALVEQIVTWMNRYGAVLERLDKQSVKYAPKKVK